MAAGEKAPRDVTDLDLSCNNTIQLSSYYRLERGRACPTARRIQYVAELRQCGPVQQRVQQLERLSPSDCAELRPPTSGNDHHRPWWLEFALRGSAPGEVGLVTPIQPHCRPSKGKMGQCLRLPTPGITSLATYVHRNGVEPLVAEVRAVEPLISTVDQETVPYVPSRITKPFSSRL